MKFNLKEIFESDVLTRGRRYYNNDCVQFVYKNKKGYEATVYGRHAYEVTINIDKDENIENMSCTCAYATNDTCKHMAALLYYLENNINIEGKPEGENTKNEYKKKIKNTIFESCRSYYESWEFSDPMYDYIKEAKELIENKEYQTSFWIISLILEELPEAPIDDSDGTTGDISNLCAEVIQEIIEKCTDENIRKEIFEWVLESLNDVNLEIYLDKIEEYLDKFCKDKYYVNKRIEMLDTMLEKLNKRNPEFFVERKKMELLKKKEQNLKK